MSSHIIKYSSFFVLVAAFQATACPVETQSAPQADATGDVAVDTGPTLPMVDLLLVVEPSAKSTRAIQFVIDEWPTFVDRLGAIDLRVSVTTSEMQCEIGDGIENAGGRFNTYAATEFPPASYMYTFKACSNDADCAVPGETGVWRCSTQNTEFCITNPNGTHNTRCTRECSTDGECREALGLESLTCANAQTDLSGCLVPPRTTDCPASLPAILGPDQQDLFHCIATVQPVSHPCHHYDEALNAAVAALDPEGPNAAQSADFIREGALLVVVFVAKDDDCSTPEGQRFGWDDVSTCALQPTTDEGGMLLPV